LPQVHLHGEAAVNQLLVTSGPMIPIMGISLIGVTIMIMIHITAKMVILQGTVIMMDIIQDDMDD
jgi:hypothetical protein